MSFFGKVFSYVFNEVPSVAQASRPSWHREWPRQRKVDAAARCAWRSSGGCAMAQSFMPGLACRY